MSIFWQAGLLLTAGFVMLLLALLPCRFGDQLGGRVVTEGVVQWGVAADASATSVPANIADGQYGAWKVDYQLDGAQHTGLVLGRFHEGEKVSISAPTDGSIYRILHEAPSAFARFMGWPLAIAAVITIPLGLWRLAAGFRRRSQEAQQEAREQLALRYPQLFPPAAVLGGFPAGGPDHPQQPGAQQQPPQVLGEAPHGEREQGSQRPSGLDLTAPYDI